MVYLTARSDDHPNNSEFFILFQSYLKDFPKASPRKYAQEDPDSPEKGLDLWVHKL